MDYVMGVDHGGTKTHALIADLNGKIHAFADNSDFSHAKYPNLYLSTAQTLHTIEKALKSSNLSPDDIGMCFIGYRGADWDFEFPKIAKEFIDITGIKNITVVNDSIGAMRGGTDKPYGGVICVGTGLNCAFRNKKGEELLYGYFVLDKDCGGIALGQMVLDAVFEGYIGLGPSTVLEKLVIDYLNIENIKTAKDLLMALKPGTPEINPIWIETKLLAPLLFKAERMNDKVAIGIIENFADRLYKYISNAIIKLNMEKDEFDIVFSGGVLKGSNTMVNIVKKQIMPLAPNCNLVQAKYEPVCGLVFMCYDKLFGYPLKQKLHDTFDLECQNFNLYRNIGEKTL